MRNTGQRAGGLTSPDSTRSFANPSRKPRNELLWVRENLRDDTRRVRGRKATLVQPYRVSARSMSSAGPKAARRRDLVKMVRTEILRLHPQRAARRRAALVRAGRLARGIIAAIPVLK